MPTPNKNESKQDFLNRCTKELIDKESKDSKQAFAVCNRYWDDAKGERAVLTLSAPLELKKNDDGSETNSFMITAYTGKPIERWWGKTIFDVKGMQAKAKIPVLREHKRDRVVGFSQKAWHDESHFYIDGDFAKSTKDGEEVLGLALEGFPWQASVAVWPKKIMALESDKESYTVNGQEITGPAEIWIESMVGEVSFVSLGADDETAAIVMSDQKVSVHIKRRNQSQTQNQGGTAMDREEFKTQLEALLTTPDMDADAVLLELGYIPKPAEDAAPPVDVEKLTADATEAGRNEALARVMGIMDLCKLAGHPEMAPAFIKDNSSVDDARKKILEAKAQEGSDEEIFSTLGGMGTGKINPLIADAQKRAETGK